MSKHSQAKSKAKAFIDIRDRDINARALFDPRFDKKIKTNEEKSDSIPLFDLSGSQYQPVPIGKVEEPSAQPEAIIQLPQTTTAPEPVVSNTPQPISFNPSEALFYGDSIATGLGHSGLRGDDTTDAQWGRGAGSVLSLMNKRPVGTFKGKDVVLSTGILNSGANWPAVRSQINLLNNRGARSVRLVGVPNTSTYSGWNEQLQKIAGETGAIFLGGYTPSRDGVHMPNYSNYSLN